MLGSGGLSCELRRAFQPLRMMASLQMLPYNSPQRWPCWFPGTAGQHDPGVMHDRRHQRARPGQALHLAQLVYQ